jgi:hypothetical protein
VIKVSQSKSASSLGSYVTACDTVLPGDLFIVSLNTTTAFQNIHKKQMGRQSVTYQEAMAK